MPENNKYKHIVVMRLSAMGDVAMIVPVLLGLVKAYPDLKITVISRPFFEPFFKEIPNVIFFAIDLKKKHKGVLGLYQLYQQLSDQKVDAFVDLHYVLRSRIVGFFFKIKGIKTVHLDKSRADKKALTRLQPKTIQPLASVFSKHLDVFKQLPLLFSLTEDLKLPQPILSEEVRALSGLKQQKWIGIAPFAQHDTKVYPLDLMQKVVSILAKENIKLFLFGGGATEKALLDTLAITQNTINITGRLSFPKELELISHLDVMLSMDSGNGHIAAMYGVPVVTLWGNTHPYAGFAPYNQPIQNSITPDLKQFPYLPTSIYGNKKMEGYTDCMKTISPQEVADKVLGF